MSLQEMCLQLPMEARIELCKFLQDSITREKRVGVPMGRPVILKRMMAEILGVDNIPVKSRKTEFTWARNMIAYQLVKEGMTESETGRFLGKDHSTINYMKSRMDEALRYPRQYQDVMYIWKQFQNKIENETNRGSDQESFSL